MKNYIKNNLEALVYFMTIIGIVVAWGIFVGEVNGKITVASKEIMGVKDTLSSLAVKQDGNEEQTEKQLAALQVEVALIKKYYVTEKRYYNYNREQDNTARRLMDEISLNIQSISNNKASSAANAAKLDIIAQ